MTVLEGMGILRRRNLMVSSPPLGMMTCRTSENSRTGEDTGGIFDLGVGIYVEECPIGSIHGCLPVNNKILKATLNGGYSQMR